MIRILLLTCLLWLPVQTSFANTVDQDLEIVLTVGFIGSNVPEPYASSLSIGDRLNGSITAQNVDDSIDGVQTAVFMSDHQLSIAGVSYDRASSGAGSGTVADVLDGLVTGFLFQTTPGGLVLPDLQYELNGFWRLLLPGWSQSSPTNFDFEINGSYSTQPAVIPLPAAAWLFGSGLLGLLGIARRKTSL